MKRTIVIILTLLGLLSASSAFACKSSRAPIKIALFDFAPYYAPDTIGEPIGTLVDKIDEVLSEAGCRWQGTFYPAPVLLNKLFNGYADMVVIVNHPLMDNRAQYIQTPIDQWHVYSYQKQGVAPVHDPEQLHHQKVIAIRGYGYGGLFTQLIEPERDIELIMAADTDDGLRLLEAHPDAHFLSYRHVTAMAIEKLGLSNIHRSFIDTINVYMMLAPRFYEPQLRAKLEQILADRHQQGIYQRSLMPQ